MKKVGISVIIHEDASLIVDEYFSSKNIKDYTRIDVSEILHTNKKLSYYQIVKRIERKKRWGFCSMTIKGTNKTIHLWFKDIKKDNIYDVISLISHEVGHLLGAKSEEEANKFSAVSCFTFLIMKDNLKFNKI